MNVGLLKEAKFLHPIFTWKEYGIPRENIDGNNEF